MIFLKLLRLSIFTLADIAKIPSKIKYPSFENYIFGGIFAMSANVKIDVKFFEVCLLDRPFFIYPRSNCLVRKASILNETRA
jgi:hypothetical protein